MAKVRGGRLWWRFEGGARRISLAVSCSLWNREQAIVLQCLGPSKLNAYPKESVHLQIHFPRQLRHRGSTAVCDEKVLVVGAW